VNSTTDEQRRIDPQDLATIWLHPRGVLTGWKLAPF
jgi:hypothetical protein